MSESGRELDDYLGIISSATPLLLATAAKIAFPDGSMTPEGLRHEIRRGRLAYETIAGETYTTLADIATMRRLCRMETVSTTYLISPGAKLAKPDSGGFATNNDLLPRTHDIADILVSDVLTLYYRDKTRETDGDKNLPGHIKRLNTFWVNKTLIEINPKTCRDYVSGRRNPGGARRDLEVLRAAINSHAQQNLHFGKVNVTLPPKGEARQVWITRSQFAAIIWAAWRYREIQTIHAGKNKDKLTRTDKRPLRHVARFLLIGGYTGTRAGAIASASIKREIGKSYVDLDAGLFYRQAHGRRQTKKRQPVVPLPPRLLQHMRRWVRLGLIKENFVEYRGKPVKA